EHPAGRTHALRIQHAQIDNIRIWRNAEVFTIRDPAIAGSYGGYMRPVAVGIISASFAREILAGNYARIASVNKGCVIGIYARIEHGDSNPRPIEAVDSRAVPGTDRIC